MIALVLASILVSSNSVTFTARATGVDAGTPIEFFFAGADSDRDYESIFLLEDSLDNLAKSIERAGVPIGKPMSYATCNLWPVGCELSVSPPLSSFLEVRTNALIRNIPSVIYTGGVRQPNGRCLADTEMPKAAFALYDCPQSLLQFNGTFPQEQVYGAFVCTNAMEKGVRRSFTLRWDGKPLPPKLNLCLKPGQAKSLIDQLKLSSEKCACEAFISFDDDVTVAEAVDFANALAVIDSVYVKINGRPKCDLFYRAFLPLTKWENRTERLTQPFEVHFDANGNARIIHIEEDWSVEGLDPKLTEREINLADMSKFPTTSTVFFFISKSLRVGLVKALVKRLPDTVTTMYVFAK